KALQFAQNFFIDAGSVLTAPQITNVVSTAGQVTVQWAATSEARSFLVRIDPIPFTGVVTKEMVVPGTDRSVTLSGLSLVPGAQYQVAVFFFPPDVKTPEALVGPFNIGAHGVVTTAVQSVVPNPPTLIGPGSASSPPRPQTVTTLTPTMRWNQVSGATG